MPVNRNALIRYKTIDKCLQNRYRKWTLNDLIDACSEALYEYEGIRKGVSKRTVQADIQMMRSDKLGYNAPIIVTDRKYYTYEEADYSITNIPLTDKDLQKLSEAVEFVKQFRGFSHFNHLEGIIQKLEDHIYSQRENRAAIIDFEQNSLLKGLHFLEKVYQAILRKRALKVVYQSFKAQSATAFIFCPYLLKEYNNRWFVLGNKEGEKSILNLALDRIEDLDITDDYAVPPKKFDARTYFKDVIGVSVRSGQVTDEVHLLVSPRAAPYLLTKPLHHSQKQIDQNNEGIVLTLEVQLNIELEQRILAFGEDVKVIKPAALRRNIRNKLKNALDAYDTELAGKRLIHLPKKFVAKGVLDLQHLYTQRSFTILSRYLDKVINGQQLSKEAIIDLMPHYVASGTLPSVLFNQNLKKVLQVLRPYCQLRSIRLLQLHLLKLGLTNWHQQHFDTSTTPPAFALYLFCFNSTKDIGRWEFLPGSHQKAFTVEEINLLSSSSIGYAYEQATRDVLLFHPYILKRFVKGKFANNRVMRVIELVFA